MKQELMKKILPIVEKSVDDILKSFGNLDDIRKSAIQKERHYQDLNEEKEKELADIKRQKTEAKKEIDEKITGLENARGEFKEKSGSFDALNKEIRKKKDELNNKIAKSDIDVIRATEIRESAEQLKADADKLKTSYELKLASLQKDFEKIEKENQDLELKNKKLTSRVNEFNTKEIKLNQRSLDLNDFQLELRLERKEIDRLIKRYNLKQSLKEK